MRNYLTIDGGTTTTRISLLKDGVLTDTVKYEIGARASINDKEPLRRTVREGISMLLARNGLGEGDVHRILASGMITSEFGLYRLDHLIAPAGIAELHDAMEEVTLPEISPIPFVFMRGVRTEGDVTTADVMRGEETELMGLSPQANCVYVLPGSHSKIIRTDEAARIQGFCTTLTGEMIAALSKDTILKSSLELLDEAPDREFLLKGFDTCEQLGFNAALFKVRICDTVKHLSKPKIYAYFMGVILHDEVRRIQLLSPAAVTIGGKRPIREALTALLESVNVRVRSITQREIDESVPRGAVAIYEYATH